MSVPPTEQALQELVTRGLIAAEPPPQALGAGNIDRRNEAKRTAWRVTLPAGGQARLILGFDLAELAAKQAAFAEACPDIATTRSFYAKLDGCEALAETFFDGPNLADAATNATVPEPVLVGALRKITDSLAASESPSTEAARHSEWQAWSDRLLDLPVWQSPERAILAQALLPALYRELANTSPATRWTNGDFLPSNILLNARGEARLIDTEFAARTHFHAEDAARFRVLSTLTSILPALDSVLPAPALPWHIYF
ncbi:MAG TPA: hypothetical protein VHN79_07615, partial [Lacunisphaera sp.]|nr:hypothetical protein [Lacunisphaera sp.]